MTTHLARVQQAVDFIEENLNNEDLALADVARHAGYSSWHFQRIFGALVGESLKSYVRRRRLTAAWQSLAESPTRILDVALEAGFESQEAFTRAFKAQFGRTPGSVRAGNVQAAPPLGRPRITAEYLDHLFGGVTMEPKIVSAPQRRVVGLDTSFISILSPDRNNHEVLPKLWGDFIKRRSEISGATGWTDFGLCGPLPSEAARRHPDEYWYMAGAEVSEDAEIPPGMVAKAVPAGKYAVFVHKGSLEKLEHTMRYIFGSWLPKSGAELRDAPDVEVYGDKFKPGAEDSEMEIHIPVK